MIGMLAEAVKNGLAAFMKVRRMLS